MTKKPSGTKEWSEHSVNFVDGCEHNCRYCYARANAVRFGRLTAEEWDRPRVRQKDVDKRYPKYKGRVMFPTAHDITPAVLEPALLVLGKLLEAGNDVLLVSKPHLECVYEICKRFPADKWRDKLEFRFSIGCQSFSILRYWEPGAPGFGERHASLIHAFEAGHRTSVSCEPLLDPENVRALFNTLEPSVTSTIWIGCLNQIDRRCVGVDSSEIARIKAGQTPEAMRAVYEQLKDEQKVRWKESYSTMLGLPQTVER